MTSPSATICGAVRDLLLAEPSLGLTKVTSDYKAEILDEDLPAVVMVPLRQREQRQAGGQGAGSKVRHMDLALYLFTVGVGARTDDGDAGFDHNELLENICTRMRTASWASLACSEWAGEMLVDRYPPNVDGENLGFRSVIILAQMGVYLDG